MCVCSPHLGLVLAARRPEPSEGAAAAAAAAAAEELGVEAEVVPAAMAVTRSCEGHHLRMRHAIATDRGVEAEVAVEARAAPVALEARRRLYSAMGGGGGGGGGLLQERALNCAFRPLAGPLSQNRTARGGHLRGFIAQGRFHQPTHPALAQAGEGSNVFVGCFLKRRPRGCLKKTTTRLLKKTTSTGHQPERGTVLEL